MEYGIGDIGQVILSEEDACSIDEVESALLAASYDSLRDVTPRHFEFISKKKPGNTHQK